MGVTTECIEHDRLVGFRGTIPRALQECEVTQAALQVFNNFVEVIAKVSPPVATMRKKTEKNTTRLRRSGRLKKTLDAPAPPTSPAPNPRAPQVIAVTRSVATCVHGIGSRHATVVSPDSARS